MSLEYINTYAIIGILLVPLILLIVFFLKYYETGVFLILLAPMFSAFFAPNLPSSQIDSEVGIGSYLRISIIAFMGFISIIKIIQLWDIKNLNIKNPINLLILIIIIAYITATYSIDQNITLIRATTFLFIIIFCLGIYSWIQTYSDFYRILNVMYYLAITFIVLNLFSMFLLPSKAWWITDPSRFEGILDQPNSLGAVSRDFAILLFWKVSIATKRIEKINAYFLIFILIVFIMLSGSRTSIFTASIGFSLWLMFNKYHVKLMIFLFIASIGLFLLTQYKPENLGRDNDTNSITDLTGRDQFWNGALLLLSEKPVQGYGFEVGGKIWQDARFYDPNLTLWSGSSRQSLHNGYLSIAIGLGLPGFLLWMIAILIPFIRLRNSNLTPEVIVFLVIGIIFLITNFVETTIDSGSILFWLTWTMLLSYYKLKSIEEQNFELRQNAI